jgi:intracellular sulfur oxidation DsrE/DsrF family protein
MFEVEDAQTKKPLMKNIYYSAPPGTFPIPGMPIDELMKDGVLFGICDMALTFFSGMVAKKMNMDAAAVKKEWVDGVMPGIQIVPSGVLAVNRTQEHGCTYCFAG